MPAAIRHILCPTDFSECSDAAIRYAEEMARALGARVTLMHVNLPLMYGAPEGGFGPVPPAPEDISRASDRHLREQAKRLGLERFDTLTVDGQAADAIADVATHRGYDLVVMGTHGRTGFKRLMLGSVAEHVVRLSHVPVLTIR
jgi:nucleotide-binding universal stress UspA family protein